MAKAKRIYARKKVTTTTTADAENEAAKEVKEVEPKAEEEKEEVPKAPKTEKATEKETEKAPVVDRVAQRKGNVEKLVSLLKEQTDTEVVVAEAVENTKVSVGDAKFVVAHNDNFLYYADEKGNEDRSKNFGALSAIVKVGFVFNGVSLCAKGTELPEGSVYNGPVIM